MWTELRHAFFLHSIYPFNKVAFMLRREQNMNSKMYFQNQLSVFHDQMNYETED